ncbi:MAG TPA: hypothetical protein VLM05_00530, partial [Mycobacteriales bacterium]|nr:hypothetical protein [Mycobacteriales bacterium]
MVRPDDSAAVRRVRGVGTGTVGAPAPRSVPDQPSAPVRTGARPPAGILPPRNGRGRSAFRVLVVCSGNVCRSPLAERLLRARLDQELGAGAGLFTVTSAGTTAVVGAPMDPRAAAVARSLGADPDHFRARDLDAEQVIAADLVLTATRQHRGAVLRLHPAAHRYTFTLREFDRLTATVRDDHLPDLDPVNR